VLYSFTIIKKAATDEQSLIIVW